jgi:hypothetical protein
MVVDNYEPNERFELGDHGLVLHGPRVARKEILRNGTEPTLHVSVERTMFGGPDTFQVRLEQRRGPVREALPFFEPDPNWDNNS